ncbi:hypothetical protein Scep_024103 [Stephania cephalantha]|uniref:Uncharacterized protein n=1 Tax=Stephania cephalantha TaxID=152367 RepID=A0AAP0F318_9MAGN
MHPRDRKGKSVVEAREGESFRKAHKRNERDRRACEAVLTQNPNAGVRIGASPRPAHSISASSPGSPRAPSATPSHAPSQLHLEPHLQLHLEPHLELYLQPHLELHLLLQLRLH